MHSQLMAMKLSQMTKYDVFFSARQAPTKSYVNSTRSYCIEEAKEADSS